MAQYEKPLPDFYTPEAIQFYEGCKRHELLIQRCKDCGAYRHYPRPMCSKCNSMNTEWVRASGKGKVYTWTVTRQPFLRGFMGEVPYVIAIVELEEGVRITTNLSDCKPDDVYVGMPVEVIFDDVTEEVTLPKFRPVA